MVVLRVRLGTCRRRPLADQLGQGDHQGLSLAFAEGEEVLVLGGDEGSARRNLDLMSMAVHLATKHDWIEAPQSDDYVARVRVHDLAAHPDRLDDVIGEIAMGRSILEG